MHQVVIAVRGIHSRRAGTDSGIIRAVVLRGFSEFGPVDRGFVGIGVGVVVVMTMLAGVIVPVIGVVVIVIVRHGFAVRMRREHTVQSEVHVRCDLEAEHPQHHRNPRERAAAGAVGGAGEGHRGLAEYSDLTTVPRGAEIGKGAIRTGGPRVWRPTAR